MRYRPAARHLRIERLDDLTLVHHRLSGETHILSPEMEAIFTALPDGGARPQAVLATLKQRFADIDAGGGDAEALVAARLAELETLGLIDTVP